MEEEGRGFPDAISRHLGRFPMRIPVLYYVTAAASLVVLSLAAGVVGTTIGLVRAKQQRALAEARQEETQQVADFAV